MSSLLKGIIYISTLRKDITLENIKTLSQVFSIDNKKHNISGVLLYSSGTVMQYIEGERTKIDKLYLNILKDDRHYNIITLFENDIDTRIYTDWGLKFEKTDIEKLLSIKEHIGYKHTIFALFNSFVKVNVNHC